MNFDYDIVIVYDSRIFKFPEGPTLGQRLYAHILNSPIGRERNTIATG